MVPSACNASLHLFPGYDLDYDFEECFEGGFEDGGEDGGEEAAETEVAAQDERASEPHGKHTGFADTPRA